MFELAFDLGPLHFRIVLCDQQPEETADEDEEPMRDVDMAGANTERAVSIEPYELPPHDDEDRRAGFQMPRA